MEFNQTIRSAATVETGVKEFELDAGKHLLLKIHKTTEINETVPINELWHVVIQVQIEKISV